MSETSEYRRGHARSASHAPVGPVPPLVSAMKPGHTRAHSQGQITHQPGHKRTNSRTEFTLPPGHQDRASGRGHQRNVSRTTSHEGYRRGHSRQVSNAESVYTIRKMKVPLMSRLIFWRRNGENDTRTRRVIVPNHDKLHISWDEHPNRGYATNEVSTTKYTLLTFLPKNLWEQFHRFANLYFLFIVFLNWVPAINAFGKELAIIPVVFVLGVTLVKDVYEDYRRWKSDRRVNDSSCLVFDGEKKCYKHGTWSQIRVGDIIKIHCNDLIPADTVLLNSSNANGSCYIETRNLDGENNLKQRSIPRDLRSQLGQFRPEEFNSSIECEQPTTKIYQFHGTMLLPSSERLPISTDNLLLRNCVLKNTDWIEGFVVYAGSDSKAMLNHGGQRYKRSNLEERMNTDVIWCVLLLIVLCIIGAVCSGWWLSLYDYTRVPFLVLDPKKTEKGLELVPGTDPNPAYQSFLSFWTFVIVLQVMIPLSLYVTIEITKLAQIYYIHKDPDLKDEMTGKETECRALNITEELGQVQYIFSDKTGTLTENNMIFRRCFVNGRDYNHPPTKHENKLQGDERPKIYPNHHLLNEIQNAEMQLFRSRSNISVEFRNHPSRTINFFTALAVCNTVVVAKGAHQFPDSNNEDDSLTGLSIIEENGDVVPSVVSQPSDLSIKSASSVDSASSTSCLMQDKPPIRRHLPGFHRIPFPNRPKNLNFSSVRKATMLNFFSNRALSPIPSQVDSPDSSPRAKPWSWFSTLSYSEQREEETPSPVISSSEEREPLVYEAESPDELALVDAATGYNVRLVNRCPTSLTVCCQDGTYVHYEILFVLPFDSSRKRMSIILRDSSSGKIVVYTKGADSAMFPRLIAVRTIDEQIIAKTQIQVDNYAKLGLRTLVIARRNLSKNEYDKWFREHLMAEMAVERREAAISESFSQIEANLELLGATGVEDKLQKLVPETINSLRQAGIVMWVLTGDKQETAINIAYSCSLFSENMEILVISGRGKEAVGASIKSHLETIQREQRDLSTTKVPERSQSNRQSSNSYEGVSPDATFQNSICSTAPSMKGLVVEGSALTFILDQRCQLQYSFLELTQHCSAVLCCRTTPLQKAILVKVVKQKLKKRTLAIGDGANDVSMIQTADVGVGISGLEGMQAVMASDFAIPKFRMLNKLILVHGHWCYDRLARMVQYFFYKNTSFVLVIFWYQIYCGFSASTMMDQLYLMFFNLFFTALPPMAMGILDQDAPAEVLTNNPRLYLYGRESRGYRMWHYWINTVDAVFQSLVIFFVAYLAYNNSKVDIWEFGTCVTTTCVFVMNFHIALDFKTWTTYHVASILISIVAFFGFALTYSAVCSQCYGVPNPYWVTQVAMSSKEYWLTAGLTTVLALLPRVIIKVLLTTCSPSDIEKAAIEHKFFLDHSTCNTS
ncbi:hypothetical protein QYM36_006646 [Artemia franciscana]|uniref:Phospholipid-transporting ATPase n=2 Tax=Artemia franciscana TaxID=6661 RepID=A0AA88HY10_ARTSF|nr:hypothetical protein QYM36_006646 [Artemia franciscana]